MKMSFVLKTVLAVMAVVFGAGSSGYAGDWVTANPDIYYTGGNVGIGTASPSYKLHIHGSETDDWLMRMTSEEQYGTRLLFENTYNNAVNGFLINTGGNLDDRRNKFSFYTIHDAVGSLGKQIMTFDSRGYVGIGTTGPTYRLHIHGTEEDNWLMRMTSEEQYGTRLFFENSHNNAVKGFLINTGGTLDDRRNKFSFYTIKDDNGSLGKQIMTFDSHSKIGIGTTAPSNKLHVHGTETDDYLMRLSSEEHFGTRILIENSYNDTVPGFAINSGGDTADRKNKLGFYVMHNAVGDIGRQIMTFDSEGNVGIGTSSPQTKLAVNGIITTKEIKVTSTGWADYVFEEGYSLKPLEEVESFIQTNKHLPDIPSGEEIQENGLSMADMMARQMAKIEELTLYMIDQNKKIEQLSAENRNLKSELTALKEIVQN